DLHGVDGTAGQAIALRVRAKSGAIEVHHAAFIEPEPCASSGVRMYRPNRSSFEQGVFGETGQASVPPLKQAAAGVAEPHAMLIVAGNRAHGVEPYRTRHRDEPPLTALHARDSSIGSSPDGIRSIDVQ